MRNKLLTIVGVIAIFALTGITSAQNLLLNGDFAVAGTAPNLAADWTQVSLGGWNNREANANGIGGDTNNYYLAMGTSDWNFSDNLASQKVAVVDSENYKLSVDAGDLEGWWHPHGEAKMIFLDATDTELGSASVTWGEEAPFDTPNPWTNYSVTTNTPAGTTQIAVVLANQWGNNGGGTMRFDNAVLQIYNPVLDTDNDGLPDFWEIDNGLDPFDDGTTNINNGAIGDPDSDTLVNSNEFVLGTDPQDPDTDGDGLTDADEVNNTFTDPLDADSDDDYLSDGDEVNIHLTDPLDADSDDDDVNDATEVYAGSDPNVFASVPVNARPDVIGLESFYFLNGAFGPQGGGELFDYDNNVSNDLYTGHTGSSSGWDTTWNTSYITAGRLETRESGMIRALNGEGTGGGDIALFAQQALSPEVDSELLYAKVDITLEPGVSWGGLSLFATGQEEIYFGVGDDGSGTNLVFQIDETGVGTAFSTIHPVVGQTYTMVVAMDASAGDVYMWLDPNLASPKPGADIEITTVIDVDLRCDNVRLSSGGAGSIFWDNLVVGTTWDSLSATDSDTDSDGLPDAWEIYYGLDPLDDGIGSITNGPSGDPDIDTLLNSEEFVLGTDPTNADTDYDGLNDDVEVNTTGSDPLVWDTDGDGLNDGDEVNTHGTDPNVVDTDLDGEDDWFELFQGTDPNDILSTSASEGIAIVDGTLEAAYGAAVATQTVNTAWTDNLDELDAAYAYVKNGRLYLMLTGNMNTNWNSVEVFIDSSDAVTTNVFTAQGHDNTDIMNGLVFDEGFSPDYHVNARMGNWEGFTGFSFNLNYAELGGSGNESWQNNAFADLPGGISYMGPGDATSNTVVIGFDNSNVAGVISDVAGGAANQTAALDVATGLELSIALADLGDPTGEIRIMAMVTGSDANYGGDHAVTCNQVLPGVPAPQGELGITSNVNFSAIDGDQFFTVTVPFTDSPVILSGQLIPGNFQLSVAKLQIGAAYKVQETADLTTAFSDAHSWNAVSTNDLVNVPADTVANPVMFYKVIKP